MYMILVIILDSNSEFVHVQLIILSSTIRVINKTSEETTTQSAILHESKTIIIVCLLHVPRTLLLTNIMVYQYFGVAYTINLDEILTFSCEILCHLAWFVFRKCIEKTRLMNLVT